MNKFLYKLSRFPAPDARSRRGAITRKTVVILVAVLVVLVVGVAAFRGTRSGPLNLQGTSRVAVKRGNLLISILQSGELEAKRSETISNETDRQVKIVKIVDDGAKVKKGDLLLELESEELRNRVLQNESDVSRAEADLKNAEEDLEIKRLKHQTDLESARLRVEIAKLELQKYTEAEYKQQVDKARLDITVASEELSRAQTKLDWTKQLVEHGYANRQELDSDKLEVTRKEIEVKNKEVDLQILQNYTYQKELKQKQNEVAEAEAEVERLAKTYESERARGLSNLESKKTGLEVARRQLKQAQEQLDKTLIISKFDGQVFYPKSRRWDERTIEEGASVYPRQTLLEFPDLSAWNIKVGVPESIIDKIKVGQNAVATVDAMPGVILKAQVSRVSVVPDTGRWWDTSTKTYTVTLDIPTTPTVELKPGMSAAVEILVDQLKDILTVPIQAVVSEKDRHFVFLLDGGKVTRTEVETGDNNENQIQIVKGLEEGQELLLYAPVEAETRAGLRERPLDKAQQAGVEVEVKKVENGEPVRRPQEESAEQVPGAGPRPGQEGFTPSQADIERFRRLRESGQFRPREGESAQPQGDQPRRARPQEGERPARLEGGERPARPEGRQRPAPDAGQRRPGPGPQPSAS